MEQNTLAKVPLREKFGYGFGDLASNLVFSTITTYLAFFYTDIFGISAAVVGTLFLVARFWDAISDPIMGTIADRTRTRWGSYRPWLLWMAVPFGVMAVIMFTTPDLGISGKIIYAYVTYVLMVTIYTAINIPYGIMDAVITQNTDERTSLNMARMVGAMVGSLVVAAVTLPLVNILGKEDQQKGFMYTIMIFAVLGIILYLLCFFNTTERVPAPEKRNSLRHELKSLKGNGPWLLLFISSLFFLSFLTLNLGTPMYYFNYVLIIPGIIPLFLVATIVSLIIGTIIGPYLSLKLPAKKWVIMIGGGVGSILTITRFFFSDNVIAIFIISIIASIFFGLNQSVMHSMYSDCIEYGQYKNGIRAPGIIYASLSFSHKLAMGIAGGAIGWMLAAFKYVPGMEQTGITIFGINLLFSIIPGVLGLIGCIVLLFHRLDRKKYYEILKELNVKIN